MKKIYDQTIINDFINKSRYHDILQQLPVEIVLFQYEKQELVTSPFHKERWFQIIVQGNINIYFIRNDGFKYALSQGGIDYILGDMEMFDPTFSSIYTEAKDSLLCLAISIDSFQTQLLNNNLLLQMICQSLTRKMSAITTMDAAPCSLDERVLSYLTYKCQDGILKGIENAAFQLHCSSRHLQRIMNKFVAEGIVIKIAKGTYKLINKDNL